MLKSLSNSSNSSPIVSLTSGRISSTIFLIKSSLSAYKGFAGDGIVVDEIFVFGGDVDEVTLGDS
jgi:hypothetical protein